MKTQEPGKKLRVLAIETDEFMRFFLSDIFWLYGSRYHIVFNIVSTILEGKEFIAREETRPNILIIGVPLTGQESKIFPDDLFGFIRDVKANHTTREIYIIIFSSYADPEITKKFLSAGADKIVMRGEHIPNELIDVFFAKHEHEKHAR